MRILYIHQYAFKPTAAGFTRPIEIMAELAQMGHSTCMISGCFSHITRRCIPEYRKAHPYVTEDFGNVTIYRVSGLLKLTSTWRKLFHHLSFMTFAILRGLVIPVPDVVVASSPSPFAALAGYIISVLRRRPFALEIRDLWPEDLLQEGLLSPGLAASAMEAMMMFLYRRAGAISCVTMGICDGMARRGLPLEKIYLSTNSIDPHRYESNPIPQEAHRLLDLDGKFVVLYAGNHGVSNALDSILDAAQLLLNYPRICFLMVGDGEEKQNLIAKAVRDGLHNITFLEAQPKEKMPFIYAAADCSVVPLKNVPIYQGALPNKLLDSMASETAVLVCAGEEAQAVVRASGGGLCAPPENSEALADAILELHADMERTRQMAKQGRKYVAQHYSHRAAAEKLERELFNVVERSSH